MHRRRKQSHARHEKELNEYEAKVFVSVWEYEDTHGKWTPFPIEVQRDIDAMACGSGTHEYKEFKEQRIRVLRCSRDTGLCYDTHGDTMGKVRRRMERRTAANYPEWWTISANDVYDKVKR